MKTTEKNSKIMKTTGKNSEIANEIKNVYAEKGLNGVYDFLKRNGINYTVKIKKFGGATYQNNIEKMEWISESNLRFDYESERKVSDVNGKTYYILRGIEIIISE